MDCLGVLDSGNYAYNLCSILERKGYIFEVVSMPCKISKGNCSYCLKFPEEYISLVLSEAAKAKLYIREIYKIIPMYAKNKYELIYSDR